jgi:type VI secretion system protein VasG
MNYEALIGRLNPACHKALEEAAALCLQRRHVYIEIEHLFAALLQATDLDLHAMLRHYRIEESRLQTELTRLLDRLRPTFVDVPEFSDSLVELLDQAWKFVVSRDGQQPVRSGHLLTALLSSRTLERHPLAASRVLESLDPRRMRLELDEVISGTSEDPAYQDTGAALPAAEPQSAAEGKPGAPGSKTPALDRFTIDLTQQARDGKIDPILGRDPEIRLVIDILTRRRQNNPILTGEAGVGKTAVVEGFALRVAAGDVPPPLRNVAVRTLDLGLLQAGAGVRGEFENRLKAVIDEVRNSAVPIILFIDEAHTLIGAGGSAGQGDAANLLKPALARGGLRVIAATTWSEYKKYFEEDAALARRFQVVKVEQPDVPTAIAMVRGLVASLEQHHGVLIQAEAVEQAVKLSDRYISGRQLPDKAVSLLDTTCARVALSQHATPAEVEDAQRTIDKITHEIELLERETLVGANHSERLATLEQQRQDTQSRLAQLQQRWDVEQKLVARIKEIRTELHGSTPVETARRGELLADHHVQRQELIATQGECPLVHAGVDAMAIAETVSAWTGIPLGRMVADELRTVLRMRDLMEEVVVGQSHALEQISQAIQTSRANLTDPSKPIGVFLLAGTSGVGKTETAITLANLLYGGEQNMTVINMSEFKEEHKVSLLMGAPPGYVGYGKGGVLTEAVRRKPYSVVLLDEMEKAHPGVQDVFYQVFDKGTMKDGEGRDIDFRNTVILMTTNAGSDLIKSLCGDPELLPTPDAFMQAVFPELLKTFKAAFLGRVKVVPYYPLRDEILRQIIELKLGKIARRLREHYQAPLQYNDELISAIATRCTEADIGARNIDNILTRSLLPDLSTAILARLAAGEKVVGAKVLVAEDGRFLCEVS